MFLHIDLDCFFVSAQRSVDKSLKGKAIAVGGRSNLDIFDSSRNHTKLINQNSGAFVAPVFDSVRKNDFKSRFVDKDERVRGIIVTSSYEARAKGIKTAMSLGEALRIYPQLIVVPSNYPLYHDLSKRLYEFLQERIPKVEQFSIDEWFGDVSGWINDNEVYNFAKEIQKEILEEFDLPCSIGISKAKWIAKLATEDAKPLGVFEVKDIAKYISNIPLNEFPGFGKGYQARLNGRGVHTLGQITKCKDLFFSWGKPGIMLYNRVLGIDGEKIEERGERKSIGISRTFDAIYDYEEIRRRVLIMCRNIVYMVKELNVNPTTYYLKINYESGVKVKDSISIQRIFSEKLFKSIMIETYEKIARKNYGAIKISVNVSNFIEQNKKTYSMLDLDEDMKQEKLTNDIQKLRQKFGLDIIKSANELIKDNK